MQPQAASPILTATEYSEHKWPNCPLAETKPVSDPSLELEERVRFTLNCLVCRIIQIYLYCFIF